MPPKWTDLEIEILRQVVARGDLTWDERREEFVKEVSKACRDGSKRGSPRTSQAMSTKIRRIDSPENKLRRTSFTSADPLSQPSLNWPFHTLSALNSTNANQLAPAAAPEHTYNHTMWPSSQDTSGWSWPQGFAMDVGNGQHEAGHSPEMAPHQTAQTAPTARLAASHGGSEQWPTRDVGTQPSHDYSFEHLQWSWEPGQEWAGWMDGGAGPGWDQPHHFSSAAFNPSGAGSSP